MSHPALRIRLACPIVGDEELDALGRVLNSGRLTDGPETCSFEREFADYHGVEHAVAMANGTVALAAIYLALGIGPGDEVIVPSLTFISSVTSVLHVGATPVFAEVDPNTYNLDPTDVAPRITRRTRAVLVVHYGGQPAELPALRDLTDDAGIDLIEDAAEAHGASYRGTPVGGWGAAGMFSFTPTKNITMGEGGMVTTRRPEVAHQLRLLRNHGQTALYRHELLGWNWRLSELQAAMGRVQLTRLRGIIAQKRANAAWMAERLGAVDGLTPPRVAQDVGAVYMLYTLWIDRDRDRVLEALLDDGIEGRIYFPPVHRQPLFAGAGRQSPGHRGGGGPHPLGSVPRPTHTGRAEGRGQLAGQGAGVSPPARPNGGEVGLLVRLMQGVYRHTALRRGAGIIDRLPASWTGPELVWTDTEGGRLLLATRDRAARSLLLRGCLHEAQETAVFRRLLPSVHGFLDVGASYGFYTGLAAQLMPPNGRRVAVEANQAVFACLDRSVADLPQTAAVHAAALDEPGYVRFSQATSSDLSSAVRAVGSPVVVRAMRVDDLWPSSDSLDLVKCDVEGGELQVLRGARRTRQSHHPVWMLELDQGLFADANISVEELAAEVGEGLILWRDEGRWEVSDDLAEVARRPRLQKNVLIVEPSRVDWMREHTGLG